MADPIKSSGSGKGCFGKAKKITFGRFESDGRKFVWLIFISLLIAGVGGWGIKVWFFQKKAIEYYEAAQKLARQKDWLAAEEEFQRAIRWGLPKGEAARAGYLVATYYLPLKDYDEAIKWYRWVVKKYPDSPRAADAQFMLAEVYRNCLEDSELAIEEYKKFVDSFPEHRLRPDAERRILSGLRKKP